VLANKLGIELNVFEVTHYHAVRESDDPLISRAAMWTLTINP
jgi:hypothetical protein